MSKRLISGLAVFLLPIIPVLGAAAEGHQHHAGHSPSQQDGRQMVAFPEGLAEHTRANMRDHLLAVQEITAYLAEGKYDSAAETAEKRLGMSSLPSHGAHEVAKYMPSAMAAVGSDMHRSASEFALAAQNADATGDVKPALAALAKVQGQCVACHAGFMLK